MIKTDVELDINRDELMRAIQLYFERLYESRVVLRGRTRYGGGAYYLSLPTKLVRKYNMNKKTFDVRLVNDNEVIIVESSKGLSLKNYGNKRGPSYYLLFPVKRTGKAIILVEREVPLRLRVILA